MSRKHLVLIPLAAAIVVALTGFSGITEKLGAHPWWSAQTAYIGAGAAAICLVGVLLTLQPRIWLALVSAIGAVCAYGVATFGKARFAASYAEDAFAGVLWHYGWIGTAFFTTMTLGTLLFWRVKGAKSRS